jgi:hypothetical protein
MNIWGAVQPEQKFCVARPQPWQTGLMPSLELQEVV